MVWRIDFSSWAQLAHAFKCSSSPSTGFAPTASSMHSRASLQVITPPSQKLLQLHPQCFVGAEQQRLGGRLAQLEHFGDLPVVHVLVLVHDDRQPLPLGQRLYFLADRRQPFPP